MKKLFLLVFFGVFLFSKTLTIYCGITMGKALKDIKKEFIKTHPGVKVKLLLGSSGILLKKIKLSKRADLYLPGSPKFILDNKNLFARYEKIGYNQIAIFVKKGNPKHITSLKDFLRKDVRVGLGNENSSVGKNARKVLLKYGGEKFLKKVLEKADSQFASVELIQALKEGVIDAELNWKAMIKWHQHFLLFDVIEIPTQYAPKKSLLLAVTSFSKHKDLANEFLDFAVSEKGQEIMDKWGFR